MGPPTKVPSANQLKIGYNNMGTQGGIPMQNRQPIRDPEFSDEEYNRGIHHPQSYNQNNHQDPYNQQLNLNQINHPQMQHQNYGVSGNYDNQFQQMSSNNRRMM